MAGIETTLNVHVQPGARKSEAVSFTDDVLRLKIAAPPVEGKANQALVEFLAKRLDLKKSAVTIVKGQTARDKVIAVTGLALADVMERLNLKKLL